jgi:hypothetical protein
LTLLNAVKFSADFEQGQKPMTKRFLTQFLAIAVMLVPLGLQAQSLSDFQNLTPEERRAYWDSMSEQEHQAKRDQWHAERQAMSDEERAAMREEMRARRNSMSEEERQAKREQMRTHRDSMSNEERQAMRAEMRSRWQGMSDEERAAARDRHHGQRDGGRHPGGRRGDK